jgi:hypothetical protein
MAHSRRPISYTSRSWKVPSKSWNCAISPVLTIRWQISSLRVHQHLHPCPTGFLKRPYVNLPSRTLGSRLVPRNQQSQQTRLHGTHQRLYVLRVLRQTLVHKANPLKLIPMNGLRRSGIILPDDETIVERIVCLSKRYTLVERDLYRHGTNDVLLQCVTREEGCELLVDIHGGECRSHSSSRTLVGKAFRHGFYRPTTLQDDVELIKRCEAC